MKVCKECQKEFEPKNPKAAFCSPKCRQKDFRKRQADNIELMKKELKEVRLSNLKEVMLPEKKAKEIAQNALKKEDDGILKAIEASNPAAYKQPTLTDVKNVIDKIENEPSPLIAAIKISEYKAELLNLGAGQFATQRRKFLEKKIKGLQKLL
jgi:endogenous inhibitor of DNA gyrase (YacG/DUF329 family)